MKFIIYGATHGIGDGLGRQVGSHLIERGHQVLGLCRSPEKALQPSPFPLEAVDILSEAGSNRIKALINEQSPDAIWWAAGVGYGDPFWIMPDSAIDDMIESNVLNLARFCRTCAPSCLDGGPHLILTGSIAGVVDGVGAALYAGLKGFLIPFVRGQQNEYSRQGHNPKLSVLALQASRITGTKIIADAVEFIGRQSRAIEILIH